jgi:hypothetical protein
MMALPAVIAEGEEEGLEAKGKNSGTYSIIIYSLYEIRTATINDFSKKYCVINSA